MVLTKASPNPGPGATRIALSTEELAQLHCDAGDTVRALSINVRKNANG
jgi:arginine N-succinyltransferase